MNEPVPRPVSAESQGPVLRAGDVDRDRVAAVLADALATGHLDPDEHSQRLEAAYSARTLAELHPLTADLPVSATELQPVAPPSAQPVTALFSKVRRGGQWPVPPTSTVRARWGKLVIDLRHAVFTRREVVIEADAFCGLVEVVLPPHVRVYDEGSALFAKRQLPSAAKDETLADGPIVRITGRALFGQVRVRRAGDARYPWREWR
ncbi:DUF1707 SHOCT-like domain-containing protein [Streptacidiphilus anmyonensis]|uniref:DUF1707 SHOCT-like domain-containing protein n=1 Tax=Streptacidiphilus anmyonensis TaxID=405782 RepID=UPI000A95080B|nr:DUF1707 domain-containing protein [Streptacidiphilus anmyonensis]